MKKYNNLDGLRSVAAIGIICMHVLLNLSYKIDSGQNYLLYQLIGQFGSFVNLFMIISGFVMCCGFYEKIRNNQLSMDLFYRKRYEKVFPFFALLVVLDLLITFILNGKIGINEFYEAYADLTLAFAFLPNSRINVIGVGWTLGVIFGFYMLFPFFVFLLWNRKRAWFAFVVSIGLNYLCEVYFLPDGKVLACNVARCACFFLAGGLIYLYRDKKLITTSVGYVITILGLILVFLVKNPVSGSLRPLASTVKMVVGFSLVVIGVLGKEKKFWSNAITKSISKVSLEMYLAHMMVYRVIEKAGLTQIVGENAISYVFSCTATIIGVYIFSQVYYIVETKIKKKWHT